MAVIDFLPDRLNNPPRGLERVHIRGVCAGGRHRCYCRYPSGNTVSSGSFCRMAGFSDVHAADAAVGYFFLAATGLPATSAVSQKIISGNVWRNCAAVHVCPEP